MKGVVLAGGTGSRLRPITNTSPKQLIPIGNTPVLIHAIEALREAGIDDIGVVLGRTGRDEIQATLGDGSAFGVDITYIVQGEPLGLAHAVGCARDFVGTDPFVVYLGDNVMREGVTRLVNEFDSGRSVAGIGLKEVRNPSRYGIAELTERSTVRRLVEKPDDPPSNLALIGVYLFTTPIFEQIEALEPSWRGELEITAAIQGLLEDGHRVQSHVVRGWWKDIGTPADVLSANRLVLDEMAPEVTGEIEDEEPVRGRVTLGDGSLIEAGAVVRGPVSIGEDTRIGPEAYVGPYTSIGDDCVIDSVHVESSVVMDASELTCDRAITDSLIGPRTTIASGSDNRPAGVQLVVAEHSSLEL